MQDEVIFNMPLWGRILGLLFMAGFTVKYRRDFGMKYAGGGCCALWLWSVLKVVL